MKVPDYFKSFDKPITLPGFEHHRERWFDEWGHINSEEAEAMLPRRDKLLRGRRDKAYRRYIGAFSDIRPGVPKFQVIRVHDYQHANTSKHDWWRDYMDCVFRVWVNPHTIYNKKKNQHMQYYIICPEDIYLMHCAERHEKGLSFPKRTSFKYISPHKELRKLRVIPVECCKHFRHETTGGALPEGL